MSYAIFPFRFLRRGFRESLSFRTGVHEQGGGRRTVQKLHASAEFVAAGALLFPNAGGSYSDFEDFWLARYGGFDPFLYKAQDRTVHGGVVDTFAAVAAQTDFDAARKYVDVATVVVKKNGVTQTLTTHYTLQNGSGGAYVLGTSPKLTVHFLAAPGAGVTVTVEYDFYYPVRFEGDDLDEQELHAAGLGGSAVADRTIVVRLRETGPGFSYASVPNSM